MRDVIDLLMILCVLTVAFGIPFLLIGGLVHLARYWRAHAPPRHPMSDMRHLSRGGRRR